MRISVIITMYNVSAYIERCAISLFEQTYRDMELIFVDDASSDDSVAKLNAIVEQYGNENFSVKVLLSDTNQGVSMTRRCGMEAASGEYMVHVDGDDYVAPHFIEKMANKAIETHADVVMCGLYYDYGLKLEARAVIKSDTLDDCVAHILSGEVHGSLCNKLIRSSIIRDNQIYPKAGMLLGEDKFVVLGVLTHVDCVAYVDEPLYYYNKTNQLSSTWQSKTHYVNVLVELVRHIEAIYEDKEISSIVSQGLKYYKAIVLGHVLLYSDKLNAQVLEDIKDVDIKSIIGQPVSPIYYKMIGVAYKCKLKPIVSSIRYIMRVLKK